MCYKYEIVLSVLLRFTSSDYSFGDFKLFLAPNGRLANEPKVQRCGSTAGSSRFTLVILIM